MAITMAISAPVFLGVVGLSVETGYWYFLQNEAQVAADVSAYASAISKRAGSTDAEAQTAALNEAANLGHSSPASTVLVNTPPSTGPNRHPQAVEVLISYQSPQFFSQILGVKPSEHSVRAVATFEDPSKSCILALDIDAARGIEVSGNADIEVNGCEMMSNSIRSDAFYIGGSADLGVDCVNTVGQTDSSGAKHTLSLFECPAARTNLSRAPDPYADVPPPDLSRGCQNVGGAGGTVSSGADGVRRICNGLNLNKDYHFEPGVYIIDGGDFRINGSSNITGDDVTFYLTDGAEVTINGNATVQFSAPNTGAYAGLLIMGDSNDTNTSHTFNGSTNSLLTGAIYTPAGNIDFSGDFSGVDGCMQLVGATVKMTGSTEINSDCTDHGIKWAEVPGDVNLAE